MSLISRRSVVGFWPLPPRCFRRGRSGLCRRDAVHDPSLSGRSECGQAYPHRNSCLMVPDLQSAEGHFEQPLLPEPKFKDMVVLRVDFDSQKDVVKQFGARIQSTLIVYKGKKEVGRSVGDTDPASIAALLEKAL